MESAHSSSPKMLEVLLFPAEVDTCLDFGPYLQTCDLSAMAKSGCCCDFRKKAELRQPTD